MLQINEPSPAGGPAVWNLGFRPFFLGAALYGVVSIAVWMAGYVFGAGADYGDVPPALWHAHEMIFGYAVAVIAGFLLTAIRNWTGVQTLHGYWLMSLFLLWATARISALLGSLPATAVFDLLFLPLLIAALSHPVIRTKQWKQIGVLSKVFTIACANIVFYLGAFGVLADGMRWGLYLGLYIIVALILVLARRVVPFFIERGVGHPVTVRNWKWLDVSSLVLFVAFFVVDIFTAYAALAASLAVLLFVLHSARLWGWHVREIWSRPMLWILYSAYIAITAGFLLKACSWYFGFPPFIAIHAFAFGGIGMMTLGMMSRVSLGHTGRSVLEPPKALTWAFLLLLCGTVARVLLPLASQQHYLFWIAVSQLLWMLAFVIFLIIYTPMLLAPRTDGKFG